MPARRGGHAPRLRHVQRAGRPRTEADRVRQARTLLRRAPAQVRRGARALPGGAGRGRHAGRLVQGRRLLAHRNLARLRRERSVCAAAGGSGPMKKIRLSRRTVLRGLGGVAVGLPVLECMLDNHGEALAQSVPLPKRYAIVFAGQALGGDDWADNTSMVLGKRSTDTAAFIVPPETGAGYT